MDEKTNNIDFTDSLYNNKYFSTVGLLKESMGLKLIVMDFDGVLVGTNVINKHPLTQFTETEKQTVCKYLARSVDDNTRDFITCCLQYGIGVCITCSTKTLRNGSIIDHTYHYAGISRAKRTLMELLPVLYHYILFDDEETYQNKSSDLKRICSRFKLHAHNIQFYVRDDFNFHKDDRKKYRIDTPQDSRKGLFLK